LSLCGIVAEPFQNHVLNLTDLCCEREAVFFDLFELLYSLDKFHGIRDCPDISHTPDLLRNVPFALAKKLIARHVGGMRLP
jgi:hypothetical protein